VLIDSAMIMFVAMLSAVLVVQLVLDGIAGIFFVMAVPMLFLGA
jgi:hypothetical protein